MSRTVNVCRSDLLSADVWHTLTLRLSVLLPGKVSDMLWNVYSYYKQFVPCVEQSIDEARKPIEKELKVCKVVEV